MPRRPGCLSAWPVLLATLFLLLGGESVQAQSLNGLRYTVNADSTITITGFDCASSTISTPDRIEGLPVTSIGRSAFANCRSLTSVTMPSSVTSIGSEAFMLSGLTNLTIPNGVTSIGDRAFIGCDKLTTVTIPSSVTRIADSAFQFSGLTQITIPVTQAAGAGPVLIGPVRLENGSLQFSFAGTPAATCSLLFTTDPALPLSAWTEAGPVMVSAPGQFQFTVTPSGSAKGFYRVRSL